MLEIRGLNKSYGSRTILDIGHAHIPAGITHLKGINGSGKTTLSKIISGLIPFTGQIIFQNEFDLAKAPIKYRKLVNYAESEISFPEFLTANDLMHFTSRAKGGTTDQLTLMAETFGLTEYANEHVGTYSSGMLKRMSLALAFLGDPRLILLDEPFNTLDEEAIKILGQLIQQKADEGVNFILVSHQDIETLNVKIDQQYIVKNQTINQIQ